MVFWEQLNVQEGNQKLFSHINHFILLSAHVYVPFKISQEA